MNSLLREYIRQALIHMFESKEKLLEPDEKNDDRQDEMSTLGAMAIRGVTTPLGTGPTYPAKKKKVKKKKKDVTCDSFGGGKYKD